MNTNKKLISPQWQEEEALARFQIISPLLDESLDEAKYIQLRRKQAEKYNLSDKTVRRYVNAYRQNGFEGLKPRARHYYQKGNLPDNYEELVHEAIQLRREVPSRSVEKIILILEMEKRVAPGVLKRSTLQRHLYEAGFGAGQMEVYRVILAVCLGLYFVSELVMDPRPIMEPRFYWNLDSACYYIIYYCIGWLNYEPVNKMMSSENKKVKCLRTIGLVVCAFFSAKLFFGRNLLNEWTGAYPVCAEINSIINAMFSILLVIAVSNYLSHNEFICKMGKNSLYLCGNEYLIKLLVPMVFSMIGITVAPTSPVQFGIYTFVLLIAANYVLVPLEKPVLKKIQNKLYSLTSDTKVNIC